MEWKIKKRHSLREKDIKKIKKYIRENLADDLVIEGEYEICKLSNGLELILTDKSPSFLFLEEKVIPSLRMLTEKKIRDFRKYVVVDMGAVPHIANGADVMVPGVVEVGDFKKDEFVFVGDKKNEKILSIGTASMESKEISEKKEGKAIKTLHYAGDRFWNFKV
ncbi:MAG: DUF1947 domain-containing protein [Euryarchaeota archaeon]|nr:DUF1947 domain-containing protein [Euryarchaeota archaeon]